MPTGSGTDHKANGANKRADGTDHQSPPGSSPSASGPLEARGGADAYYNDGKSIRIHARPGRSSLALRLAVPIVATLLAGLLVLSLLARERFFQLFLADLKADATNVAFVTAMAARPLIVHRENFLALHPEYLERGEWKAGDHWLVTHGFVSPEEWMDATGFQPDEYAPASVMDKAGEQTVLAKMSRFLNSTRVDTELVGVYIHNADGSLLASSQKTNFRFDARLVKNVPLPRAFFEVGDCRLFVDYLTDQAPEPIVRAVALILRDHDDEHPLGTATAILRTQKHHRDLNAFSLLLLGLGLLLSALVGLASWLSARRVAQPMRRLAHDMQAIAEGDYSRRATVRKNDEMGALGQAFNSMVERLRVANLNARENTRLETDLAIARDIQNNLLPPQTPRVRGLDINTSYRPAKEIGGDYYDFLPVDEQHMGMVIADASGKSIPAALVMSTTRAVLRFVAPGTLSAAETLTRVNAILSVDIPKGMFVTAYYLILDPLEGSMICASAGHTPLLIARSDGSVELLNPGGIALGFDSGPIFQRAIREQRVKLQSGDRVLLYTDGVVECVNPANEEYSDRRLREFLRRNRDLSSHDFLGALLADLDRHRGAADMRDDTTIVTFKVL